MFQTIPIQEISSAAIWVPLILAGLKWKTGDKKLRLFFAFLLFGALTDGLGWLAYVILQSDLLQDIHPYVQFSYLWFEVLFFVWLAYSFYRTKSRVFWRKVFWIVSSLVFLIDGVNRFGPGEHNETFSAFVYSGVLVLSAFLMAFALLHLAEEKGEILREPWFWILGGIFFYCFSCFFIDMLGFTNLAEGLWPYRVILNMIQYVFFVVGLVKMSNGQ